MSCSWCYLHIAFLNCKNIVDSTIIINKLKAIIPSVLVYSTIRQYIIEKSINNK